MHWLEALIIGLVQGLTEFLPVSSSGHIELSKIIFEAQKEDIVFTIFLHAATALSTIVVFWKEITDIFRGILKFQWNAETKFAVLIIISMIPAAIAGLFFEEELSALFDGNLILVSCALIATGFILFFSDRVAKADKPLGYGSAFIIGIMQAIAILPGISRSGSTIGGAVLLGIDRAKAARFSFLMVLPLILGASLKELKDFAEGSTPVDIDWGVYLVGFAAAFISGIFACRWMIALVKRSRLTWFAVYCWLVGVIGLGAYFFYPS